MDANVGDIQKFFIPPPISIFEGKFNNNLSLSSSNTSNSSNFSNAYNQSNARNTTLSQTVEEFSKSFKQNVTLESVKSHKINNRVERALGKSKRNKVQTDEQNKKSKKCASLLSQIDD